ncbi:MAG: globin family protein [Hyphomicrobiaceae bacterium]
MTPQQSELVKQSWQDVAPIADVAANLFYDRLFELDPSLTKLFQDSDLPAQKKALLHALSAAVAGLDAIDDLTPQLQALGHRHVAYGVVPAHYITAGNALLWTLRKGLGESWTPETEQAWTAAYLFISETMQTGAARDCSDAPPSQQGTA